MTVLFTSSRPLERAENLKAVWDAFDGEKEYAQIRPNGDCPEAERGNPVIVTDEFLKKVQKPTTRVVMIEHGMFGGKFYGLDQKVRYYTPAQTGQIDWFVTSSEAGIPVVAKCAGIPTDRCIALGMPRTDAYFGMSRGDGGTVLAEYPRAYLFAPTLRTGWEPPAPHIDWAMVDGMLGDGEILAVKRHMVQGKPILDRSYRHIIEVDPMEPSTPYLADCDALSTDYSSIIFDGFMLGSPCVLFCPDRDEYLRDRGMYWQYPYDYSPYTCEDASDLVGLLREAAQNGIGMKEKRAIERSAGACDGSSAARVANLVRSML